MKYYFNKLVKEENIREMFTKNKNDNCENDAICTISCIVMPAILPLCALFYEEGCSFIDGKTNKKILSTSPLGIIRYVWQNLLNSVWQHDNSEKVYQ